MRTGGPPAAANWSDRKTNRSNNGKTMPAVKKDNRLPMATSSCVIITWITRFSFCTTNFEYRYRREL